MRITAQVHLQPTEHIGEAIKKLNRMGLFYDSTEYNERGKIVHCSRTIDLNQIDPIYIEGKLIHKGNTEQPDPLKIDLEGSDANPSMG